MNRMRGKSAVITGGALGIGRACALKFAEEGAAVAVTDVDVNKGSIVAEEIRGRGGDAVFVEHDVADEAGWERVMRTVIERYKKLDVLVNNGRVQREQRRRAPIDEISGALLRQSGLQYSGQLGAPWLYLDAHGGELSKISGRCGARSQAAGQSASNRARR